MLLGKFDVALLGEKAHIYFLCQTVSLLYDID